MTRHGLPHLCSSFDENCPFCTEGQAPEIEKSDGSALLAMLGGPKELVVDDGKRFVTRIPGTNITISRRPKR